MAAQLSIRPVDHLAEPARPRERRAGRLGERAVRSAPVQPSADIGPGDESLALWYVPVLAATLLGLLAVHILAIWRLL